MEQPPPAPGHPRLSQYLQDADYLGPLVQELARALDDKPPATLTELLRAGRGATPDIILDLLTAIYPSYELPTEIVTTNGLPEVPELHPLLFEWYFDDPSARFIAEVALGSGREVLCLGTPSVANHLVAANSRPHVALIDADAGVTTRFPALQGHADVYIGEVDSRAPTRPYSVVVADPPWYLGDILRWLEIAVRWVRPGGTILVPLFPELTRPAAKAERSAVFAAAASIGQAELWGGDVVYRTPGFERHAFRALGIAETGDWRAADLLVVRDIRGRAGWSIPQPIHRGLQGWRRFEIGAQVVMLRLTETSLHQPSVFVPIAGCPRNTLTSVSERDPRRQLVGVWTSRNRVAAVGNVREAAHLLMNATGEAVQAPRHASSARTLLQDLLLAR